MISIRLNDVSNFTYLENFIRGARILGLSKKPMWYYKVAQKGKFEGVPKEFAGAFAQQIDSMITVLNDVYEGNWDFDFSIDRYKKFSLKVVIRFPKIEISNSLNKKHTIEDLFVCFDVKNIYSSEEGYSYFANILGTRGTLSYVEWKKRYLHSHLPSNDVNRPSKAFYLNEFCLGVDTEITYAEDALMLRYDKDLFQLYLYCIKSLVEWESIEGTPYKYIKDLTISSNSREIVDIDIYDCSKYYNYLRKNITSLNVDFVLQNDKYVIVRNQKLKDYVKNLVLQSDRRYYSSLLVIRSEENKFMSYDLPNTVEDPNEQLKNGLGEAPKYLFKGEEISFKIQAYNGEKPNLDAYFVHPNFIEYTAKQLENELYEKTVRKHTIERYYQSQNVSTDIRQDSVVM